MALTINTNHVASSAANYLGKTHSALQSSLNRLSSGKRINQPSDDAGGLAVSVKLTATIKRTSAVQTSVSNAISFFQTQDGALQGLGTILERISELRTLHNDVTKSSSDKANYNTEFTHLISQMKSYKNEKFNGVLLFGADLDSIVTSEDGSQVLPISKCTITAIIDSIDKTTLGDFQIADITTAIAKIANLRATNGAQTNRLGFAQDMLSINKVNLEAANSRIVDTDIASESTEFGKLQILAQANSAMLAQANMLPQVALKLIGS